MPAIVNPKVNVVDFGPYVTLQNGQVITPDEFVYGGAKITFQDVGALKELIDLKTSEKDLSEKIKTALINVGAAGHASMSTTPGFWAFIEGDSSKMVDTIFTTAKFGSSLMPSGRRVPITQEAVVVPREVLMQGSKAIDTYVKASERNIEIYDALQVLGVPKQEASKIVQYGHRGGGFMFMPLETLIHFSNVARRDPLSMPLEGHEIISQLEKFCEQHGMGITNEARKDAPRTGCPHPNLLHNNKNLAEEYLQSTSNEGPVILSREILQSSERDRRIKEYLQQRAEVFTNPDLIKGNWKNLLDTLEGIVEDFNDSVTIKTVDSVPWRVWGEIKRHRTMPQTSQSIYRAVKEQMKTFTEPLSVDKVEEYSLSFSMPPSVTKNKDSTKLWLEAISNSYRAYESLLSQGVRESGAISVIPRGAKVSVIKTFDLYNLLTGYLPLRTCSTAEPEMRRHSLKEMELISEVVSDDLASLLGPKCHAVGFCPEIKYQGDKCRSVNKLVPQYNEQVHENLRAHRISEIRQRLDSQ